MKKKPVKRMEEIWVEDLFVLPHRCVEHAGVMFKTDGAVYTFAMSGANAAKLSLQLNASVARAFNVAFDEVKKACEEDLKLKQN